MSTRMRSPNFPGISLDRAVNAVEQIFNNNRQAVIMREDAAKDLGYSGLTGRSMKILGALNQYNLIENVQKGQLRVTDLAKDILHGYPEDVRVAALHTAGNSPALFNSIYDRFDGDIPGENAVRSFLMQSGFTNQGVEKALDSFLATNRYLEIKSAAKSYRSDAESEPESPPEIDKQESEPMQATMTRPSREETPALARHTGGLDFNLTKTGLSLMGSTNSKAELLDFAEKLTVLAGLLPESEKASDG
ncbi:hypothetical protein [Altererythrobacter sp. Z27]|uniref:hypothetical protein n=1 Tax=Altererythrobacter sp. Z27 TaxID=3461147 RepID=UPI004044D4C3